MANPWLKLQVTVEMVEHRYRSYSAYKRNINQ